MPGPYEYPTKLVGAGVLIRNGVGDVLLVEPAYKADWEIPGGVVEAWESPRQAAARECIEELGREVDVGPLLAVHYHDSGSRPTDSLMFVFDGGKLSSTGLASLVLPADELLSARFIPPRRIDDHVIPIMAVRLRAAIEAAEDGITRYLEC